ncbi:hypothetical protein ONZ43_g5557 [Nemania bipapillata]|uniref:Uncharacterized protein n=1 Tax=Nemania bipapillata TaxID=110536 RepID=A0ACC2I951_9PEZI|nr:hypothetical protein ONZ43_g5557 [Nemania bipapillata]
MNNDLSQGNNYNYHQGVNDHPMGNFAMDGGYSMNGFGEQSNHAEQFADYEPAGDLQFNGLYMNGADGQGYGHDGQHDEHNNESDGF